MARFVFLNRLELSFEHWMWPFAQQRRYDIDAYFRQQQEQNPALWNGRLLLLHAPAVRDAVLRAKFFEADYASMIAALDWDAMMEHDVRACFPAAAMLTSDNAFIVGRMAPHTRNAGQVVFPCGSIDKEDVANGEVNFLGGLQRELLEETGIVANTLDLEDGWYASLDSAVAPIVKILRARESAVILRDRILSNLTSQQPPEFCEIAIVRGSSEVGPPMPGWMQAFLQAWPDWAAISSWGDAVQADSR